MSSSRTRECTLFDYIVLVEKHQIQLVSVSRTSDAGDAALFTPMNFEVALVSASFELPKANISSVL